VTVRRVGPAPQEAAQHRANLGRVLVTIDDLAALMTLLKENVAELVVEFDGGYFTEAEELRTLSDVEMKSLRLKTPRVQVVLNASAAFAIGERQEAEEVYRIWARARQTRLRPRPIQLSDTLKYVSTLVGFLSAVVLLFISRVSLLGVPIDVPPGAFIIIAIGALATLLLIDVLIRRADARESSYAVVIPLSLDEHRQSRSSQTYPRRSWIVAIIATIVAAVSVGVAIWIYIHSPASAPR
jgi:hypothetical protein